MVLGKRKSFLSTGTIPKFATFSWSLQSKTNPTVPTWHHFGNCSHRNNILRSHVNYQLHLKEGLGRFKIITTPPSWETVSTLVNRTEGEETDRTGRERTSREYETRGQLPLVSYGGGRWAKGGKRIKIPPTSDKVFRHNLKTELFQIRMIECLRYCPKLSFFFGRKYIFKEKMQCRISGKIAGRQFSRHKNDTISKWKGD